MIALEEINLILQIIRAIILGSCAKQSYVRVSTCVGTNLTDEIISLIKIQAMENYAVIDKNGNVNEDLSSQLAIDAIDSGELAITEEMFTDTKNSLIVIDATSINKQLEEFENRMNGLG